LQCFLGTIVAVKLLMKQKKQASSNKSEIYNDVLQQQILDDHFYEEATLKPTGIQQNTFSYLS
jgi:hypothetical protein